MKIHIIEPLAIGEEKIDELKTVLSKAGHDVVYFTKRNIDPQESILRAQGADIVVIANQPFPAEVVEALPQLKMLCVAFTGLDHVAMEVCREKGITVCNASGYSNINVSELTVGLMLDLLRNVTRLDPIARQGGTMQGLVGNDLCEKTVGIIGCGAIGKRVAALVQAFGCRILIADPQVASVPEGIDAELCSMNELLRQSDIVTLHCPLNEKTRGLIGAQQLGLMKPSAFLVNCARGPVVDDQALVAALKEKRIAGAALDVFAIEPPLDKATVPVLELENVIITPHIAFATGEAFDRRADIVIDNVLGWVAGTPKNVQG